jgi:type II secretory pathway component PulC
VPGYDQRMADVRRAALGRPAVIAIGFAVVALVTSLVAVFVVMTREHAPAPAPIAAKAPARDDRTIAATEILKLKRDVVEKVETNGTFLGVKVTDEPLRTTFGLEADDIVTAINGRAIKREFDVFDAVLGMSTMNASIVYIEVTRGGASRLLRWTVDGELRTARRDLTVRRPNPYAPPLGGNPFTAAPDPLVDSITRIDALHYAIPKSTVDQLLANPDTFARQARIVPSVTYGRPMGFKLYAIRPGSLWLALGLENGDTLRSVNGQDLSTPDKALQLYTTLKDATELQILVVRRSGIEETLVITIK